jgi:nucleoside-triphosphatase THEP1
MTIIVITGAPGVGKTTILMGVAQNLKERGVIYNA